MPFPGDTVEFRESGENIDNNTCFLYIMIYSTFDINYI